MDPHLFYETVRLRRAEILAQVENDRRAKEALDARPRQVSRLKQIVGSTLISAGLRLLSAPGDPAPAGAGWRR